MNDVDCAKLEKKYNELLKMLHESLDVYIQDSKDKQKRNTIFLQYKKRVYEEIQKLKHQIQIQKDLSQKYKKENLQIKTENYALKNKFKHLSNIFKTKRESELLNKFFPNKIELEKIIMKSLKNVMKDRFNPRDKNVLYFRKYFKIGIKDFIIKNIKNKIGSEKLAVVVAQIIIKEYEHFIYTLLAKELLNNVVKYEEFLDILLTKDLVDKTDKYFHLDVNYNIDDIKTIIHNYESLNIQEDIDDISIKSQIDEILRLKETLFNQKKEVEQELEQLANRENELLALIVSRTKNIDSTQEKEVDENSIKKELEEIDESKRILKDKELDIQRQLSKLENRELFLRPLLEVKKVKNNKVDENLEKYKKEYEELISSFCEVLLKELK